MHKAKLCDSGSGAKWIVYFGPCRNNCTGCNDPNCLTRNGNQKLTDGVLVNQAQAVNGTVADAPHSPASSTVIRYEKPTGTFHYARVYDVVDGSVSVGAIGIEVTGPITGANDVVHDSTEGGLDHVIFNSKFLTVVRISP